METRSKLYNFEINEHLHTDLFQIFVLASGGGLLISERKKMALAAPCILLVPANTLHGFAFQANVGGEVLTFSATLFEEIFKNSPHILLELNRLRQFSFESKPAVFGEILILKNKITGELQTENAEKPMVLQLLLQLFLIELYRAGAATDAQILKSDNRTLDYFQSFQKLVRQSVHETKPIGQFAKELRITPVHLNRICRSLVQKSALQIVHENLINEAKKYLLETSFSVSEVSYFLDFKDPAHFSKRFKKQVGMTPGEFGRRKMGEEQPSFAR